MTNSNQNETNRPLRGRPRLRSASSGAKVTAKTSAFPAARERHEEPKPNAVIYLRTARSDSGPDDAIDGQRHACLRKAAELGLTVVGEFADRGVSGRPSARSGFARLQRYVEQERTSFVIVERFDRIARTVIHASAALLDLEHAGARVVSVRENDDTRDTTFALLDAVERIVGDAMAGARHV